MRSEREIVRAMTEAKNRLAAARALRDDVAAIKARRAYWDALAEARALLDARREGARC
jgi:hypothetical protein